MSVPEELIPGWIRDPRKIMLVIRLYKEGPKGMRFNELYKEFVENPAPMGVKWAHMSKQTLINKLKDLEVDGIKSLGVGGIVSHEYNFSSRPVASIYKISPEYWAAKRVVDELKKSERKR